MKPFLFKIAIRLLPVMLIFITSFTLAQPCMAETYYVDGASGDNSNQGTAPAHPWKTIGKCAEQMREGDMCVVAAGVYEESVVPTHSGEAGSPITYVAKEGEPVVVRHFYLNGMAHIRIIGFEITHNTLSYNHGIVLYNSDYCEVLNNKIHHIQSQGIRNNTYYGNSNHNVIRGNTFAYTGCPETGSTDDCIGGVGIKLYGSNNLIEYNDISHTYDSFNTYGHYNVIRNNYFHDFANSDFPNGSGDGAHVDFWQPYSLQSSLTGYNLVEANFAKDIHEFNSHFFQVRDERRLGMDELIIRGNVGVRFGSYIAQFGGVTHSRLYNNTFSDFFHGRPKSWNAVEYISEPKGTGTPSTDNHNFNNIYHNTNRDDGRIIYLGNGCLVSADHNYCEGSGTHESCGVTSNAQFVNYSDDNFRLLSASSARNAGRAITTVVSPDGTGTSFQVADAGFFVGGWEVTELTGRQLADTISVAGGPAVRISSIDYDTNIITVVSSISWNSGDAVVLSSQAQVPSIGAYEYQPDYSFDIKLVQPVSIASGLVALSATTSNPGNIRYVEFYADGIPIGSDSSYPYTLNWPVDENPQPYTLTVRAYSLTASTTPVKKSSLVYHHSDNDRCACDLNRDGVCDWEDWRLFSHGWGRTDCQQ